MASKKITLAPDVEQELLKEGWTRPVEAISTVSATPVAPTPLAPTQGPLESIVEATQEEIIGAGGILVGYRSKPKV